MRRLGGLFLAFLLAISFAPSYSFAYTDAELLNFLAEEGITQDQLDEHLSRFWDYSPEDFDTIDEMKELLGERITEENLQELLTHYGLNSEEALVALLAENEEMDAGGDVREEFLYIDALDFTVSFYQGVPITPENLQQLLEDYGLTLDELNAIFASNDDSVDNYEFIEDLEYALFDYGIPVTETSLLELLEEFELTRAELDELLAVYGDSVENYDTIDDLYFSVTMYLVLEESGTLIDDLGIGLTKSELVNLVKHFMTIDFMDPALEEKLLELETRLTAFGEFDSASDLTPEELQELLSIYHELLDVFNLQAKYYLVKGNEKISLSEQELLELETTNGYDLLIELYNTEGVFLADILLTYELFGSDLIDKIGDKLETVDEVAKTTPVKKENQQVRTVNGGKLPNTAGNYTEGLLTGLVLMGLGAFWFRKRTVKHS